eukprot:TRINITY_DN13526_c0_g1_i4.p2 TRINITY_DN13526_c0_g1~~TRINITY_DN13526_c0_g1_i4.p2  ORF type:complete len:108 (-),score=1.37 TRINITY_DN13526_c0_g1_i4:136-459(-)
MLPPTRLSIAFPLNVQFQFMTYQINCEVNFPLKVFQLVLLKEQVVGISSFQNTDVIFTFFLLKGLNYWWVWLKICLWVQLWENDCVIMLTVGCVSQLANLGNRLILL